MSTVKASGNTGNTINYEKEIKKCKTQDDLFGENGLLKKLIKDAIEKMMEAEIEEYMGRKKYERTDTEISGVILSVILPTISGDKLKP